MSQVTVLQVKLMIKTDNDKCVYYCHISVCFRVNFCLKNHQMVKVKNLLIWF